MPHVSQRGEEHTDLSLLTSPWFMSQLPFASVAPVCPHHGAATTEQVTEFLRLFQITPSSPELQGAVAQCSTLCACHPVPIHLHTMAHATSLLSGHVLRALPDVKHPFPSLPFPSPRLSLRAVPLSRIAHWDGNSFQCFPVATCSSSLLAKVTVFLECFVSP